MAETKRIVILMAEAGFGHRSAAQALAAALQQLHAEDCAVEIINPMNDERVPAMLRSTQTNYDKLVREMPGLYQASYQMSDAPVPTALAGGVLAVGLFDTLRDIVHSRQPDAIIAVHPQYLAPLAAVFSRERRHIPVATVVTDLVTVHQLWFNNVSDLCLVATEEAQQVALRSGLPADKVKITGIPVNPRLSQDTRQPAAIRAELGWQPDMTTVLVAGSKRTEHLYDVLHLLNHSGLPVQLAVVAGGDDEQYRRLQYTEWHRVAHIFNFVDNMPTLMRAADFVLGKAGGLIVSEALACGRPLLLADVIEGQETGNADYVVAGGAGELVGDPVQALEIVCHWLDKDGRLLVERTENARRLGRPRAAYDMAESVWALAQCGPTRLHQDRRIRHPKEWGSSIGKHASTKKRPEEMMIPLNDVSRRPMRVPVVTILIIAANVVFFIMELMGGDAFILRWSLVPADIVAGKHLETILTSMFMHEGWEHIIGNMVFFWAFGPEIEDSMGSGRYLIFYLLGGLAATFAQIIVDPTSTIPNLGASGAIAAVMGAFLVTYPGDQIRTVVILGRLANVAYVPAIVLVGLWGVSQLFSGVGSLMTTQTGGGVAYMAHVGGFTFGMLTARLFENRDRTADKRY